MTTFQNHAGTLTFQAIVLRKALEMWVERKLQVNRFYTPRAMMLTAQRITGETYPARGYQAAIDGLKKWLEANGTRG